MKTPLIKNSLLASSIDMRGGISEKKFLGFPMEWKQLQKPTEYKDLSLLKRLVLKIRMILIIISNKKVGVYTADLSNLKWIEVNREEQNTEQVLYAILRKNKQNTVVKEIFDLELIKN